MKKIENHPHREAFHADLQQNSVYNPFSENSKAMIRELCNVELFEFCDTFPKVQCSHCLPYWNQGIVYCTCGQCLIDSESRRKFNKLRLNALSIPNYVVKKKSLLMVLDIARPKNKQSTTWLGMRGRDAVRKSTLNVTILQVFTIDFSEIQFIVNHNSQSDGQNKSAKSGMNLQKRDDTKDKGILPWTKLAKNGPMKLRSDFRAAVSMKNRLHHKSGEQVKEPVSPEQYSTWHHPSSTSWWDKSEWNWK